MNANALNSLQIIPGLSWKRTAKSSAMFTKGQNYMVLRTNAALNVSLLTTDELDWKPLGIVDTERLFSEFRLVRPNLRIYDNKGATMDSITCVFMDEPERGHNNYQALAMSWNCVAFCQHTTAMPGRHLGKRVNFEDISEECQNAIIAHFAPEEN